MIRKRPLRNRAERELEEELTRQGWDVYKRGMPDFACYKDNQFMLVEVKPDLSHHLSRHQYRLMSTLAKYGVPCFFWSPADKEYKRVEQNREEKNREVTDKVTGN